MQPFGIVNLVDKFGQVFGHVSECLVACGVDVLDRQGLHEALCLRIVIRVADGAHGSL